MVKFRGVFCPLLTPFDHRGELYLAKVRHNILRLNQTKLAGYLAAGESGEGCMLTLDERVKLFAEVKGQAAKGRLLIADVGVPSVHETLLLAKEAEAAGYDFVYAAGPCVGDDHTYFATTADRSPLPLIAQVDPGQSSVGSHPNVAGVCCRSSADDIGRLREALPDRVQMFGGSQAEMVGSFQAGATAAILPLANASPFFLLSIEEAIRTRETDAAHDLDSVIAELTSAIDDLGVGGLKFAADLQGYYGGLPRLPLQAPDTEGQQRIAKALEEIAS